MKNVTVTLDEQTARWARVEAAKRDESLSSFLRELLEERMTGDAEYQSAMDRYFSRGGRTMGGARPSREELHDRAGLR